MSSRVLSYSLLLIVIAVLGFSIIGMTQQSPREALKRPKGEYKVVAAEGNVCSSEGQITNLVNPLGQQGWELVSDRP